jgi:hypothetical protein
LTKWGGIWEFGESSPKCQKKKVAFFYSLFAKPGGTLEFGQCMMDPEFLGFL